ncbi:hypothetical protein VCHENC02_3618A, partial [Vibrio harveyi]
MLRILKPQGLSCPHSTSIVN